MSTSTEQRDQVVANAIREISHIATLPEITLKIIDLVEDPSSTAKDLHGVIANDPALCTRILKVVNSSFYGLPGQIGSIDRAIVMLGLNAVKNIAIAASLAKLFRGGELTPNFSARDLWVHSNATAVLSKVLCDKLRLSLGDEAFLAGLMHDLGIMVEMQFDRSKLIEVVERVSPNPDGLPVEDMLEVENQMFGANHQLFGAALCQKWKFPKTFEMVSAFHHNPIKCPSEHRKLVGIIAVADILAAEASQGFRLDRMTTEIPAEVCDLIGLGKDTLSGIRENLNELIENANSLLTT